MFLQYQGCLEQELDGAIMLEEESLGSGEENWIYKMMILCVCGSLFVAGSDGGFGLFFFLFPSEGKCLDEGPAPVLLQFKRVQLSLLLKGFILLKSKLLVDGKAPYIGSITIPKLHVSTSPPH